MNIGAVRRLPLVGLAALALAAPAAAASPKSGHATVACRNRIINQWEGTGKIKTTYPVACYRSALTFVNGKADLSTYSSLGDDIKLALQAALQREHGDKRVPLDVGKHYNTSNDSRRKPGKKGGKGAKSYTDPPPGSKQPPKGHRTGAPLPAADSSPGTPLPILVLGGVAIALIAAGAIGAGVRWQRRR